MLTDAQRERIESLTEQDLDRLKQHIAQFDAEELLYLVNAYNWDDGFEVPTAIATHPKCCRAIALKLFWAASGPSWYESERNSEPMPNWKKEWYAFCRLVTDGILSGSYALGTLNFDPELDRIELYKIRKAGVLPEALYMPVVAT